MRYGSILAASAALAGCSDQPRSVVPPDTPTVAIFRVEPMRVTLRTELPGRVSAIAAPPIRPQVSGLITARLFREDSQVVQGQPLYEIDPARYAAQVDRARALHARAAAVVSASAAKARRYAYLASINAVSAQDREGAEAQARQYLADEAAFHAQLRSAELDLERATIRAPIAGFIGRSAISTGALVQRAQSQPLATVYRLDQVYVDLPRNSRELLELRSKLRSGVTGSQHASVRVRLEDGTFYPMRGRLLFSEVSVDPSTGSRMIRVKVPNPDRLLLPGMRVRAEIVDGEMDRALTVPQEAVIRDERQQAMVFIVRHNGKVELRQLSLARRAGDYWIVERGLQTGERVVRDGSLPLRTGYVVRPSQSEPPGMSFARSRLFDAASIASERCHPVGVRK